MRDLLPKTYRSTTTARWARRKVEQWKATFKNMHHGVEGIGKAVCRVDVKDSVHVVELVPLVRQALGEGINAALAQHAGGG